MKIWLLKAGEILPIEKRSGLLRTGLLAEELLRRGHDVTWWTSTFQHFRKEHIFTENKEVEVEPRYRLRLLHANAYKRNISIARFKNHVLEAREFAKWAPQEEKPDLIVASMPTLDLALAGVRYAHERGIPVVVDIRDLWPEIFIDALPRVGQWAGRFLFIPMFRQLREICQKATVLVGVSPQFLEYGLAHGRRARGEWDRHFWLGSAVTTAPPEEIARTKEKWQKITRKENPFLATFVGAFSQKLELETVIEAAKILKDKAPNVHFILAGNGDTLEVTRTQAAGLTNISIPGWLDRHEVFPLLQASGVGLVPFRSRSDFVRTVPTKAIEYMSAGLPTVSCLQGSLAEFLAEHRCGVTFANGDAAALAEVLRELAENPTRRQALAKSSLEASHEFSAEKIYGAMADHLEKIQSHFSQKNSAKNNQTSIQPSL